MEQYSGNAIKLIDKIERAHRLAIENLGLHYRYTAGTTTSNKAFDSYSRYCDELEGALRDLRSLVSTPQGARSVGKLACCSP